MRRLSLVCRVCIVAITTVVLGSFGAPPAGAATGRGATRYVPGSAGVWWMQVNASEPRTIFIEGSFANGVAFLARSSDAGATWTDLSGPAGMYGPLSIGSRTDFSYVERPVVTSVAVDDRHLYISMVGGSGTPASSSRFIQFSADGGLTWNWNDGNAQNDCGDTQYGVGPDQAYPSPLTPARVYLTMVRCDVLEISNDGGANWRQAASPFANAAPAVDWNSPRTVPDGALENIVPDVAAPNTIYANLYGDYAVRSEDDGLTWTQVMTPTASPPIDSYVVTTDPREPGLLVGFSTSGNPPTDSLFLSSDHGRTWRAALCAGDLRGKCPAFTLANVFGAGHNYAFFPDGVHAFDAAGPSGPRLDLSDHLPVPFKQISSVQGGSRAGDPVYLLGCANNEGACTLYRSTDQGASWQVVRMTPATAVPSTPAPGSQAVPHAAHRVAAVFAATYRRLGPFLLGLPITEAYHEGAVYTQDFEHMRLELRGGQVVIGKIGTLVQDLALASDAGRAGCDSPYTSCGYTVGSAFEGFWQAHGGKAVFGAPIGDPYTAVNGDGSHRKYTMQLFENARLELHPETHNPAYRVELGLLGDQYLVELGWLRIR